MMKEQVHDFRPIILEIADYLFRRIAALFNEKDGKDSGKSMASNREVVFSLLLNVWNCFERKIRAINAD
jgi:hypothetical protein